MFISLTDVSIQVFVSILLLFQQCNQNQLECCPVQNQQPLCLLAVLQSSYVFKKITYLEKSSSEICIMVYARNRMSAKLYKTRIVGLMVLGVDSG